MTTTASTENMNYTSRVTAAKQLQVGDRIEYRSAFVMVRGVVATVPTRDTLPATPFWDRCVQFDVTPDGETKTVTLTVLRRRVFQVTAEGDRVTAAPLRFKPLATPDPAATHTYEVRDGQGSLLGQVEPVRTGVHQTMWGAFTTAGNRVALANTRGGAAKHLVDATATCEVE